MTITQKIPLWLDCDPGHDDMIAILLSAFHPNINLVGLSSVFGNSTLQNTTFNLLSLTTGLNKLEIPVYQGNEFPLNYPGKKPSTAPGIHGDNGLAGHKLPHPVNKAQSIDQFYQDLAAKIELYDGELSIAAVGPLTNIADFFMKHPDCKPLVKYISIMGGGIGIYNFKGHGEFNIWNDPTAANFLFQDPILKHKILLSPLNVTHTLILNATIQYLIYNKDQYEDDPFRQFLYDLMIFLAESYKKNQDFPDGPPIHDPIAVYVLLVKYGILGDSQWKESKLELHVDEQINGEKEGEISVGLESGPNDPSVIFGVDVQLFWDQVLEVIRLADVHLKDSGAKIDYD